MSERKSVITAEIFVIVSMTAFIIVSAFFLFKMKELGFSKPELGVMSAAILLVAFSLGDMMIRSKTAASTRILSSIVMLLVSLILLVGMTLGVPWIKEFFVL